LIGGDIMDPDLILEANEAGQKVTGNPIDPDGLPVPKKQARRRAPTDDLPPAGIQRWVIRRKAQVVAAVQSGRLTLDEVVNTYSISVEEFQAWQAMIERHGIYGLRSTRSQIYRARPDATRNKKAP
jgi:hypothetical protein